jgi:hypothetical protein
MPEALSLLALIALIALTLFIVVFLHELGHAIPALLMTQRYQEINIYIGSFGDPSQSFRFTIGRLEVYVKYNPFSWYKGCCIAPTYDLSIDQNIGFVAGGPLVSICCAIGGWFVLSATQQVGFFRVIIGSVFTVSLLAALAFLIPDSRPRYGPSGQTIYSDTVQLYRLLKTKFS